MIRLRLLFVAAIASVPALAAAAPQSSHPNIYAESYDVRLDVQPDGSLDVTETIALTVGAKPMSWFERTVPRKGTDGLANVVALMDGRSVPVTIDQGDDLKVRWEFSPIANATRTFQIQYRAVHVLSRALDGPRLEWTALPRRHTYPIDSAEVSLFAPAGTVAERLDVTGGDVAPATPGRDGIVIVGRDIKRDRSITVDLTFAPNSIRPVEAEWAILEQRQRDMFPAWMAGAATLFVVGIGILVMLFAQLPRPKPATGRDEEGFVTPASAGSVPPGLAALVISRGRTDGWLAMQAGFFRLVRDGQLLMEKRAGGGRLRSPAFDVTIGAPGMMAPHEQWIVDEVRAAASPADFRKLMHRWSRKKGGFLRLLRQEATANGWLHAERVKSRSGLMATGFVLMIVALFAGLGTSLLAPRLGPAPLSLSAVTFVVGLIYIVVAGAMSLLSEAGLREAARWQARIVELKGLVKGGVSGQSTQDFERWFPLAIGAGFGAKWLKAFQAQLVESGAELAWLRALGSPADAAASLAVIVAASTTTYGGGAGGAGGAGGGSSGAG